MTQAARQDPARIPSPPLPLAAVPGWAIISAALAPVLGITGYLVAGILQPAAYSPMRQTVSVMAGLGGTDRWVMTGALFAIGGAEFITAAALTALRPAARALLLIAGISSIGIAYFPEPASGSTPPHLAFTALGAASLAVFPALTAMRAVPRPALLSPLAAATVTAAFGVLLAWLVIETQGGGALGLAERVTSSVESCWPLAVALSLRCAARRAAAGGPDVRTDDEMACPGSFR
jgi:hypothetical membrane protein